LSKDSGDKTESSNFKVIEKRGDIYIAQAKYLGGASICSNCYCKKQITYGDTVVMVIDKPNDTILAIFEDLSCMRSLEMEFQVTGRNLDYAKFPSS
jgi:hypothetical protein